LIKILDQRFQSHRKMVAYSCNHALLEKLMILFSPVLIFLAEWQVYGIWYFSRRLCCLRSCVWCLHFIWKNHV